MTLNSQNHSAGNDLPQGEDKIRAVRAMFDNIAPRYDMVNRLISFRLDVRWRRRSIKELRLTHGNYIIDLACGTGDFCNDLLRVGFRPIGFDISSGMLKAAKTDAPLVQTDILSLPLSTSSVDGATCGFALRNLVELPAFFSELGRVLRPKGRIALLDIAEPENKAMRWGHNLYFGKLVPKIGALLSDKSAYSYLPKSTAYLPEPLIILEHLRKVGFTDVRRQLLFPGSAQLITATRVA